MSHFGLKRSAAGLASLLALLCASVPAFAGIPATGDGAAAVLPIVGGLLIVSLILIIVFAVLSAKKKKK